MCKGFFGKVVEGKQKTKSQRYKTYGFLFAKERLKVHLYDRS